MEAQDEVVALVTTGVANVASVNAAFLRLGVTPTPTADPRVIERAAAVVLPGVGAFGAGAGRLAQDGLGEAIADRVRRGAPLLGICLGMQLLGEASDESPDAAGLGVLPARAARLDGAPRLPHFGWNRVLPQPSASSGTELLAPGDAYFAHTYAWTDHDALRADGWRVALAIEGEPFVAAAERGGVLACQFHPELSGAFGAALLRRWLRSAGIDCTAELQTLGAP